MIVEFFEFFESLLIVFGGCNFLTNPEKYFNFLKFTHF